METCENRLISALAEIESLRAENSALKFELSNQMKSFGYKEMNDKLTAATAQMDKLVEALESCIEATSGYTGGAPQKALAQYEQFKKDLK